jgi:hypothetical protein
MDCARTGWFPFETTLDLDTAPGLRPLFTQALDGPAYTQPLYVGHLALADGSVHNVVFAATQNDTLYAFDADTSQPPVVDQVAAPRR